MGAVQLLGSCGSLLGRGQSCWACVHSRETLMPSGSTAIRYALIMSFIDTLTQEHLPVLKMLMMCVLSA